MKSGGTISVVGKVGAIWKFGVMARLAGPVIPGIPHYMTQRANRRQQTFFNEGDYVAHLQRWNWHRPLEVRTGSDRHS